MFNLGPGEVIVLIILGILFLGPTRLPDLAARLRDGRSLSLRGRWSWSDWFLVCAALVSATVALQLTIGSHGAAILIER